MMTLRNPRLLPLALIALFVPLQAGALEGDRDGGAQFEVSAPLSVTASLGQCGTSDGSVICQVTISWSAVADADYYTAVVTAPDGAYMPLGTVGSGAGSATVWIPYSGDGTYSISVMAWGYDTEGKPKKVGKGKTSGAKKSSKAAAKPADAGVETVKPTDDGGNGGEGSGDPGGSAGSGGEPNDAWGGGGDPKPTQPDVEVETEIAEPAAPEPAPAPKAPTPVPPEDAEAAPDGIK